MPRTALLVPIVGVKLALLDALALLRVAMMLLPSLEVPPFVLSVALHAVIVRTSMQMYCGSGEASAFSKLESANIVAELKGRFTQVTTMGEPYSLQPEQG